MMSKLCLGESDRAWVQDHIGVFADQRDQEGQLPRELFTLMGVAGLLAPTLSIEEGGRGWEDGALGEFHGIVGKACSSTRSILTVHNMLVHSISRWGSAAQRKHWLLSLADGQTLGAFALSEKDAGSSPEQLGAQAIEEDGGFRIVGEKKWVTGGMIADLFLLFARGKKGINTFLIPADTPGLTRTPITDLFGTRASMLATLHLDCWVSKESMLGGAGFGLGVVAASALDLGRFSVAWGCVGIAEAALSSALKYTRNRKIGGIPIADLPLASRLLSNMITRVHAARLLCVDAGKQREAGASDTLVKIMMAKHFAADAAMRTAVDALQLQGAEGCTGGSPAQRYLRDAKVMEIIEGNTQLQELMISRYSELER